MDCKHDNEALKIEDVLNIDFHKTNDDSDSKRWKTLKCKKCGQIQSEPVL